MTAIKEKPILFTGEMVRALLDGKKSQTRRVIKPQPNEGGLRYCDIATEWLDENDYEYKCPYEVGTRLWVREAWHALDVCNKFKPRELAVETNIFYSCDKPQYNTTNLGKYRHARFMPRWASRITLEVTDVRAENLVTLSYNDAIKEGFDSIKSFKAYWDKINKKRGFSWQSRPWVWIYEFKRSE